MKRFLVLVLAIRAIVVSNAQTPAPFHVEEATIADIQAALKAKRTTCRALVEQYLRRIDAYDKNGPALNAIVQINPDALKQAEALDQRSLTGALHCVPMIVKDNFETIGLQSANGSARLPVEAPKDAAPVTGSSRTDRVRRWARGE